MMKTTKLTLSTFILISSILIAGNALADGYRNPPPTGVGVAKAGVHSVFVDDASAISYNPANLSLQTNSSFVAGVAIAHSENTYEPAPVFSFDSDDTWQPLPNLYFSTPIGDGATAIGIGVTTPYGQGLAWDQGDFGALVTPFPGAPVPYEARMALVNFNPTVSAKVGDNFSIGAGIDIMYSQVQLKALLDGDPFTPGVQVSSAEGEGDGWGFGGNIGITWLPTDKQRIALTYRSRTEIDYEGDFEIGGTSAGDFSTTIKLPDIVTLGYGIEINEDIQIEVMLEWLGWSENDTQPLDAGVLGSSPQANDWDDTITAGIAGSWKFTDSFVFHTGYAFIPTPIPDSTITPLLPDADRHVIGFGLGYTTGAHSFDISYAFSIYDERTAPASGLAPGTYEIDSDLVGMTYSLSF